MSEHYSKQTVSVSAFCAKCNKHTEHRVDKGRLGPCVRCVEKLQDQSVLNEIERRREAQQSLLWEHLT